MIRLTRLNNRPLAVNSDLIKFVESLPDTTLTLVTGEKVLVRERTEDVIRMVIEFRRSVLSGICPGPTGFESIAGSHPAVRSVNTRADAPEETDRG